ncbi:MAG TPA: hypothetical protein VNI53_10070 [Gammaproteobacteria bacterium]|nr:hypothetical protein [Gammaproteobacteria bacterium]
MSKTEQGPLEQRRRRAVHTAIIAALVAVAFYVGFIVFMHWTHQP